MSTPKKGRPNHEKKAPILGDCSNWAQEIPKGPIPIPKVGPKGVHSEFWNGTKGSELASHPAFETPSTAGRAEREMPTHHAHDTCSGQLVRWSSRQRTGGKDIVRPHPSDRWFQSQISSMCGRVFWECRGTVWGAFGECPGSVRGVSWQCLESVWDVCQEVSDVCLERLVSPFGVSGVPVCPKMFIRRPSLARGCWWRRSRNFKRKKRTVN